MKFRETQLLADVHDPNSLRRRLETQLAAWRMPRFEYWARPATPPPNTEFAGDDLRLWFELLRVAEPVPPRTHRAGFDVYARLLDLNVDELLRDNAIRIEVDRVAFNSKSRGPLPLRLHDWSLLVPRRIDGRETQPVLSRRFQEVREYGDRWLVAGAWSNCTDSICVLVEEALLAEAPAALMRLWQVSLALQLEYRFLQAMPEAPAEALAQKFGEELLNAADRLDVDTDILMLQFAVGRTDWPRIMPLRLPASRFARLLEVDRFFEHARQMPGGSYYDAMASAFARIAPDPFVLGNVLLKLHPGSAVLSALESVALDRPEFVATYVWHSGFHAEGAFTLLQLMQRAHVARGNHIDLGDEWLEAQQLGRELMLLNSAALDWDSLVALGVQDESEALGRRHYGVAPIDRYKTPYEGEALWKQAVSDASRAEHYVETLERYFRGPAPHTDPAFVFALRLLGWLRQSEEAALATRLATAVVDAYAAGLALDAEFHPSTLLPAYGELFVQLREALDLHGKAWRRFLRPFEPETHLARAQEDQQTTTRAGNSPSFAVPTIFREHAETLAALATALDDDAFEEPLHAALELYTADRAAQLHVGAFSWHGLARISTFGARHVGEPLFLSIGRLFGRVKPDPRWLEEFLGNEKEAHILGWVVAGLGTEHPLSKKFRPNLLALLDGLLGPDRGVALGHAMELANILQLAGIPEQSERFARYALAVVESLQRGGDQFRSVVDALLAVALVQQEKWADLLSFAPDQNSMVLSPHARLVENMRAVALLGTGNPQAAAEVLERMVKIEPQNTMALANLVVARARTQDWRATIEAATRARETVTGELLDNVILSEAHAREQLKDGLAAATLLGELSTKAAGRPDVIETRRRLLGGDIVTVPVATSIVSAAPLERLDDSVDIAVVTVLPEEYEAVCARLTDPHRVPTGEGPTANFHGWQLGTIAKGDGAGRYTVALAVTGCAGNFDAFDGVMRTLERFSPRVLLLCGIAGGIKSKGLVQGDIVLSETIWFYPYGKIMDGTYNARHKDYSVHQGLLNQGRIFGRMDTSWLDCDVRPPSPNHVPKCLDGLIGSGDIVMDDLSYDFSQAIMKARPELQAIEMEAAGAAAAVRKWHERERTVAFLVVRGVSDTPKDGPGAPGAGTAERDAWKKYASAIAAKFIVSWVASDDWPFQPRAVAATTDQDPNINRQLPPKP
jgi:nucleoside phosphorylase